VIGARARTWLLRLAVGIPLLVLLLALGFALSARQLPDLAPWHQVAVDGEPSEAEMDAGMDLPAYLAREQRVLDESRAAIAADLDATDGMPGNRYAPDSPSNPDRFPFDYNRSFERLPDGPPRGVALLVHGLTDGPYSLRALAGVLQERGWRVLVLRLPAHGSAPSALLDARWEDWAAAVRLGVRHLRAVEPDAPLLLVGYSTGAALVLKHQLDALTDPALPRAARLVLLSPLVGLPRAAGLAPVLSLLDRVPGFEKAAWLDVQPEYNPFKYNSFPVNGGWQSHRLAVTLAARLERERAAGRLAALPPVLTFHSAIDTTVLSDAVVRRFYDRLPANGSELLLYDLNRWGAFAPLFRRAQLDAVRMLLAEGRRDYTLRVITNVDPGTLAVHELRRDAGATTRSTHPLDLAFPASVFSLSHTALPFPCDDPLYGIAPRTDEDFGVRLGTLALRGERQALQVPMEQLARLNCNPFYDDLARRVGEWADGAGSGR
jgi:alpha-beta hydrolase superfamily lysophospholipase